MLKKILFKKTLWICLSAMMLSGMLTTCGDSKKSGNASPSASVPPSTETFTIYTIGDSTMATYDNTAYTLGTSTERRGWCQMFSQFISNTNVTFVNKGVPGRSSRDYYNDTNGYWKSVKESLKSGDYVFIQFAHNDECYAGLSTEEALAAGIDITKTENSSSYGRGNEAWGTYHEYLTKYVQETKALGANPVLIAPVVRLGSTPLSDTNCHNLTGNGTVPGVSTTYTSADYISAMKDVATLQNCPFIDLTSATKSLVETYGQTNSKSYIYNDADNTHLKGFGATLFAQQAAKLLISSGIIAGSLNAAAVTASVTAYNFGTVYLNATSDKVISLFGLGLSPDSGTITVTAPDQFSVSTSSTGTFSSSVQISFSGGALAPTSIYLRFNPTTAGPLSGNVTITPTSGSASTIAVSGTSITISNAKAITAYSLVSPAVVGIINETAKTITVLVPSSTSQTSFIANFTLSDRASAKVGSTAQVSGTTSNSFASAVTYTITAEDGSTTTYAVTVTPAVLGTGLTWLFSDGGWPNAAVPSSGTQADGIYNGITSLGCNVSSLTTGSSKRTGTLAGTSISFTVRWQVPSAGSTTTGYLAIPVVGPCTVYAAGLSSSSTTARNIVITDGTTSTTTSVPLNNSSAAPLDCSFSYTSNSPGTVYIYCGTSGGACSLYGLAVRY